MRKQSQIRLFIHRIKNLLRRILVHILKPKMWSAVNPLNPNGHI